MDSDLVLLLMVEEVLMDLVEVVVVLDMIIIGDNQVVVDQDLSQLDIKYLLHKQVLL